MDYLQRAIDRLKALFTGDALERDMDEEMRLHLELLTDEYHRAGMSLANARRAARGRFGNLTGTSMIISQIIRALIYGVPFYDPVAIVMAVLIMIAVAAGASYLPAGRASRVDPTVALRYE
jgi:hypothetical protein